MSRRTSHEVDLRSPKAQEELRDIAAWVSEHLVKEALKKGWRSDRVIAGLVMGAAVGFRKLTMPPEGRRTFVALAELMWDLVRVSDLGEPD